MKFRDASAIAPLIMTEPTTKAIQAIAATDDVMLVWWATEMEWRVHPLRAADALQLAAAFVVADRRPSSLELVTLDEHLAAAARKVGFAIMTVSS